MVHGKTTDEWHTNDIRIHPSDIRVTYEWHTSTYEWHTDDIRVTHEHIQVTHGWHTSTYEWHTSDIRVTYEWHTSTYEWHTAHTNDVRVIYEWHTSDIRMTFEWYTNDIGMACKIKLNCVYSVWSFSIGVFNILCGKNIALRGCEWFWLLGRANFCIFHCNIPNLPKNFEKYHRNQKQV